MDNGQSLRAYLIISVSTVAVLFLLYHSNQFQRRHASQYFVQTRNKNVTKEKESVRIHVRPNDSELLMLPNGRIDKEIRKYDNTFILRDKKIVFCWIPNNSCTQFKALFCRYRGKNYTDPYTEDQFYKVHRDGCVGALFIHGSDIPAVFGDNSTYSKLAVLRDPFQRFMSGYLDKCVKEKALCFGCKDTTNIACFTRNLYLYLNETLGEQKYSLRAVMADHFVPQYWFCMFSDYASQYSKLYLNPNDKKNSVEIRSALMTAGLPKELIMSGWGPNLTDPFFHKTSRKSGFSAQKIKYLRQFLFSAENVRYFLRIYAVDYVLLRIRFPDWLIEYCCLPVCGCSLHKCMTLDCREDIMVSFTTTPRV